VFANLEAGRTRGDRLEFSTDVFRSVRLHVEALVLSETAGQKNEDA